MWYLFSILAFLALILLIVSLIRPGRNKKTGRSFKRKELGIVFGSAFLIFTFLTGITAPKTKPVSDVNTTVHKTSITTKSTDHTPSPKATVKPTVTAKPTPTPTPKSTVAPTPTPKPVSTPTPVQQAAPSCTPLAASGNCYEPGEYCSDADHGDSGIAGDGESITCEDNDGWRWEPTG